MANMSYCRFENTFSDLRDCLISLEFRKNDEEAISSREWEYAKMMRDYCEQYIELFDEIIEQEEESCPYCGDDYITDSKNGLHRCLGCGNEF